MHWYALVWADLRREGPISACVDVTGLEIALSELLLSILQTEYETLPVRELGHEWAGRCG
jgi:hypothetical protein